MEIGKRLIVFDIRLICDIENVHFDIARNYINRLTKQMLLMKDISILRNQGAEAGTKELLMKCGFTDINIIQTGAKEIITEFHKYIPIVKPRLLIHELIKQLIAGGLNVVAYSHYEDTVNEGLGKNVSAWGINLVNASELPEIAKSLSTLITCEDAAKLLPESVLERNS